MYYYYLYIVFSQEVIRYFFEVYMYFRYQLLKLKIKVILRRNFIKFFVIFYKENGDYYLVFYQDKVYIVNGMNRNIIEVNY